MEVLAHTDKKSTLANAQFAAIRVSFPEEIVHPCTNLPDGWDQVPHSSVSQDYGNTLLASHAVIRVPSVVVPQEFNYVMNPLHPHFSQIQIGTVDTLRFDSRVYR